MKQFRLEDGTIHETNDDVLQVFEKEDGTLYENKVGDCTRWEVDTCGCRIIYDSSEQLKAYTKRCNLHKNLTGQALMTVIQAHHRPFNLKHGRTPTESQLDKINQNKRNEKNRIEKL